MPSPGLTFGNANIVRTQLVTQAVEACITLLRARFNSELETLILGYNDAVAYAPNQLLSTINLPKITPDRWLRSEVIDSLILPAGFVLAERSQADLQAGQNIEIQDHTLFVVLITQDVEITRMIKTVERYYIAGYKCLHDKNFLNTYFWVEGAEYSREYARKQEQGQRNFVKDVTLRVRARTYESQS